MRTKGENMEARFVSSRARCFAALGCVIFAIAGCSGTLAPQSRAEYVARIKEGGMLVRTDSHVAGRSFEQVVGALRQKVEECLQSDTHVVRSGGIGSMNVTHHSRTQLQVVGTGRAELTTQFTSTGSITYVQQVPPGGFYERAVDIERVSPTTTRLTYYGPSTDSSMSTWAAIRDWSDGRAAGCPE